MITSLSHYLYRCQACTPRIPYMCQVWISNFSPRLQSITCSCEHSCSVGWYISTWSSGIVYMTSAWHLHVSSTQPSVGLHRLDSQRRVIEITASQSQHLVHPQLPPNRTHHPSRPCRPRYIKNFKPIRRSCVIKPSSNSRRSAHITRPNSIRLRYRNALYPNHAQNRTVPPELDQSIQIRPRTANLGQQQSPQVVGNSLKKAFERQLLVDTFFIVICLEGEARDHRKERHEPSSWFAGIAGSVDHNIFEVVATIE